MLVAHAGLAGAVAAGRRLFCVSRTPFILASGADVEAVNAADVFAHDGASATFGIGEGVELLGGSVSLSGPGATELLEVLPTSLIIRAETAGASSFGWLLDELGREWP